MSANVSELTLKLLRALDSSYNVVDMSAVLDSIAELERVAVTKELLETTRLGRYVNELRRKTTDQELSRRAKGLLKKWRSMVIPEAGNNGQIKQQQQNPLRGAETTTPPLLPPRVSPILSHQKISPPGSRLVSPVAAPVHQKLSPHLQKRLVSPVAARLPVSPPNLAAPIEPVGADVNLNQLPKINRKRVAATGDLLDSSRINSKRAKLNGGVTDLEFSDSSNSSFKDVILAKQQLQHSELLLGAKADVIVINSDSNSSFQDKGGVDLTSKRTDETEDDQLQPKKRGRKKGSKNHKNLLDAAETSFTNKLAASRGSVAGTGKVKTTQEILAGIQNKQNSSTTIGGLNNNLKQPNLKENLEEKAAKLTERVSIIDRTLNAAAPKKNYSQKHKFALSTKPLSNVVESSGSVINSVNHKKEEEDEDEVVVVDEEEEEEPSNISDQDTNQIQPPVFGPEEIKSLSVEEALARLPPVNKTVLLEDIDEPHCTCYVKQKKSDFSIGDEDDEDGEPGFEVVEDQFCPAKIHLEEKYRLGGEITEETIKRLHEQSLPTVNGNWSDGTPRPEPIKQEGGRHSELYVNVVPNIYERLDRDVRPSDSFKKYSVSEERGEERNESSDRVIDGDSGGGERTDAKPVVFREWYECIDTPGYSGEPLRILPYCVVD